MSPSSSRLQLAFGHAVNDMFTNVLSGLLPIFTVLFSLPFLLAGLAAMVFSATASLLQPVLGRWFDRAQTTWLLEAGLAVNCIGISLTGLSPNYAVLLLLLVMAGFGAAAFHPPAFSAVAGSTTKSRGSSMGIFLSGGNAGFFVGPIVAGGLVSTLSLRGTLLLLPIGLVAALLLFKVRIPEKHTPSLSLVTKPANKHVLGLLLAITAFRSSTLRVVITFLPLFLVETGDTLVVATAIASAWLGVGVLGQIAGGHFSDRIGRKPVIVSSLLIGAVLFYGFLVTGGVLSTILLVVSGAVLYSSWSVIVAMASEAAPNDVGTASGLTVGFSWGLGGLASLAFGGTADILGLHQAFYIFAAFALIAGLIALMLPNQDIVH